MERYARNFEYYQGENLPPDNVEQPLGVNYARTFNDKHTSYLFGQWDEGKDIIDWRVLPSEGQKETDASRALAQKITDHLYKLARSNEINTKLPDCGRNGSIFGDSVIRVTWDDQEMRVRWENVLPEYVHVRWHPTDITRVVEVIVSYPISRADAKEMYGTYGYTTSRRTELNDPTMLGFTVYWERWTTEKFEQWIDEVCVKSVPNPYSTVDARGSFIPGVIPFIFIPNCPAGGEFYGFADAEPAFLVQDELNRKLADQGDIINNFAHPITIINNWFGDVEDLPVGPDQVWDLGREGKATLLQWEGSPPAVMDFVNTLLGIMFDLAAISPVAYARHRGTQQSAIALAIEMMPMTERARWKRSIWSEKLRKLMRMSVYLEKLHNVELPFSFDEFLKHEIQIVWAPMLPRDRMALVQENVTLVINHLRSIEKALVEIGTEDASDERDKILKDLEELVKLGVQLQGINAAGGGTGGTGSSALPDGMSNASVKGRPVGSTKR